METIEIKDNEGKLLYSYTCENNSISKTLKQANLKNINLAEANLSRVRIENVELTNLNLSEANFEGSIFSNIKISNSSLYCANLNYTTIINSYFYDTSFYRARFIISKIKNSIFEKCNLFRTVFWEASLVNSQFECEHLQDINFAATLFQNVNYRGNIIKDTHNVAYIGNIGSRHSCTTVFNTNKGIFVSCGCFFGTLKEFKERVLITHKDNPKYKKEYLDMINYVQKRFKPKFSLKSIFKYERK